MLSVIIPSRCDEFLQKTVDDLLTKAEGEIEVIVILDGYWPSEMLKDDNRVRIIHHGTVHGNYGMRASINKGIAIARGEYIMKTDEHCMFDQGFDQKVTQMEDDWLVIPRRWRLDPYKWELTETNRNPIDYMYLTNPFERPDDKSNGLRGAEWRERFKDNKDKEIDETMSWQGSCYIAKKDHWDRLFPKGLDEENYGPFTAEAQEIGNMYWFTGGKIMVNKKTWYAHFWKGSRGKGYGFSREQYKLFMEATEKGRVHTVKHWLQTKEYKHDFIWLMEHFWPVPTWPENWQELIKQANNYKKIDSDWYANNKT